MRILSSVFIVAQVSVSGAGLSAASGQAWFYANTASHRWCSYVTNASAEAAAKGVEVDASRSGWLRYSGGRIVSIVVTSQSEDAYVEDTYIFNSDLTVKELVRRGHYVDDPFITAVFKPVGQGKLRMSPHSRKTIRRLGKRQATYFLDWPTFPNFSSLPFASLIRTRPVIRVLETCQSEGSSTRPGHRPQHSN